MKRTILVSALLAIASLPGWADNPGDVTPRQGKYTIYSYGAVKNVPIFLGYFILGDGSYKAFLPGDKFQGEGAYSYSKSAHEVTWKSGPYAGAYGGIFTLELGGKRHQLRLKSSTVAGNDG